MELMVKCAKSKLELQCSETKKIGEIQQQNNLRHKNQSVIISSISR